MAPVVTALVEAFGDDEARSSSGKKNAVAAELLLDGEGRIAAEHAVLVSSFAWAINLARKSQFGELASWPRVENILQPSITARREAS